MNSCENEMDQYKSTEKREVMCMEQILPVLAENAGWIFTGGGIAFAAVLQTVTLHRIRKSERRLKSLAEAVAGVSEQMEQWTVPDAGRETKAENKEEMEKGLPVMESAGMAHGEYQKETEKERAEELLSAVLGEVF